MRRGFTLMELLAVIVVLSITALIATPIIYSILEDADRKSFELSCEEVYKSYDQYQIVEESGKEDFCNIFDFANDIEDTKIEDNIRYEPISKLNIKGEIPKKGIYKICNNERRLVIDNGKYTCVRDKNGLKILDGTIEENDTTAPIIESITVSSTTNSIKIIVNPKDEMSQIENYYYRIDGNETSSKSNIKIYNNLEKNKEYKIEVVIESQNGLKSNTVTKSVKTINLENPRFNVNQTPAYGYKYAISKRVTIKYDIGNDFEYYFKSSVGASTLKNVVIAACGTGTMPGKCTESNVTTLVANTWYKTNDINPNIVYDKNGTLYALTSDGTTNYSSSTFLIDKIDTSAPSASISTNGRTDRITVTATCSDAQSGITKYEYSKDNGTTWISNGTTNSYTFTGLTKETSYQYKIRCTNGSGLTKEASSTSSTLGFTNPTIKQTSQTPSSGTWATSITIQITYSSTNVASPVYYFKSSVGATVASGVVTASCGTGTNPGTCTSSNVTTLVANTWYKTTSTTPSVIYKANGTLYALTSDGANISGTSTFTISKIDTSIPTTPTVTYNGGSNSHSWKNNYNITLTSTATSGIHHYEVDWDGDGVSNYASSSNFIPWDGYSSCNNRFRAVSNSGLVSAWTNAQHIHMDTSAPSASMSVGSIKTDRATITATCSDAQSGITKYEYSKDNGTTWISNGTTNSYTFTGLTKETSYQYKIRCTNGSGLTKEASSTSSTLGFTNPTIKQTSQTPSSGTWATSITIQITYSSTNVASPVYYFKSSVGATVASGVVTASCGTGTNPGTCTTSSVTTLVANTWYKTTSTTPSVIYKANGTLYALTSDGANISGTSTFTMSKIDTSPPEVGDYIKMTPTSTSYTTDTSKTGYTRTQTINPSELDMWRVIKINSDGTMEVVSENISSTAVYFSGQTGYKNLVGYLNELANQYQNTKYTIKARHMGYNGQTEYLTDTANTVDSTATTAPWTCSTGGSCSPVESQGGGDTLYTNDTDLVKNAIGTLAATTKRGGLALYWLASRVYYYSNYGISSIWYYNGRYINSSGSGIGNYGLYRYDGGFSVSSSGGRLRPILTLKSGISYTAALGTSDDPFVLS